MSQGRVNAFLQPIASLPLFGPTGLRFDCDCVMDTGFTGYLMLSPVIKSALGLRDAGRTVVSLAGGYQVAMDMAEVEVEWQGQHRLVRAYIASGRSLLGTGLMRGSRLVVDMLPGGSAHLQDIPTP